MHGQGFHFHQVISFLFYSILLICVLVIFFEPSLRLLSQPSNSPQFLPFEIFKSPPLISFLSFHHLSLAQWSFQADPLLLFLIWKVYYWVVIIVDHREYLFVVVQLNFILFHHLWESIHCFAFIFTFLKISKLEVWARPAISKNLFQSMMAIYHTTSFPYSF